MHSHFGQPQARRGFPATIPSMAGALQEFLKSIGMGDLAEPLIAADVDDLETLGDLKKDEIMGLCRGGGVVPLHEKGCATGCAGLCATWADTMGLDGQNKFKTIYNKHNNSYIN